MSGRSVIAEIVEREPDSSPKNLVGHEADITLPNVDRNRVPDGSVMWAEPDPKGAGGAKGRPV